MTSNETYQKDHTLVLWSAALKLVAWIAIIFSAVTLLYPLLDMDVPVTVIQGEEVWRQKLSSFKNQDIVVIYLLTIMPSVMWIYCIFMVLSLAGLYKDGIVFDRRVVTYFFRLGQGLISTFIISALSLPLILLYLFYQGVLPWFPDIPWLDILDPGFLMAGIFFFILGKIMARGLVLQDFESLSI